MKKIFILLMAIILCFSGCTSNTNISDDTPDIEYENEVLVNEMTEAFYNQDYTLFEEKAKNIQELYPDSSDSRMAQVYLDLYEDVKEKEESEVADINFKDYIQLLKVWTTEPNNVGGIDLHIKWKNVSDKTIKYITFTTDLYNAVDDKIACDIRNRYSIRGQVTGPIEPGTVYGDNYCWENAWYNHSGKYAKIIKIEIEYMDESIIEIPESKIEELFY